MHTALKIEAPTHVAVMSPALQNERILYVCSSASIYRRDKSDPYTKYYIPTRALPLVRPGLDLVVLPGNCPEINAYAEFCIERLGLEREQVLYTSGKNYLLHSDVRDEIMTIVLDRISHGTWKLMPYVNTRSTRELAKSLGIEVIGESDGWMSKFGSKAILHPNAIPERRPSGLPFVGDHCKIRRARGYFAGSTEELAVACTLLLDQGVSHALIKPANGSTGEGITPIETARGPEGYSMPLGSVVIEEQLKIDVDAAGNIIAPSIQYARGVLGYPTDQIMHGVSHCGNQYPSVTCSESFQHEFRLMAHELIKWTGPTALGGFDALSVDERPVLVDINTGRWTGAHPALLFQSLYAPRSFLIGRKVETTMSVEKLWNVLEMRGIAFQPGKSYRGVFPLCFLPGMWGMLVSFGASPDDARQLADHAELLT